MSALCLQLISVASSGKKIVYVYMFRIFSLCNCCNLATNRTFTKQLSMVSSFHYLMYFWLKQYVLATECSNVVFLKLAFIISMITDMHCCSRMPIVSLMKFCFWFKKSFSFFF